MPQKYLNSTNEGRKELRLVAAQNVPKFHVSGTNHYASLDILTGMMSSQGAYDRFGIMNENSVYKWAPAETHTPFNDLRNLKVSSNLNDIMMERAQELLELIQLDGKKLILFWSGGVDSTAFVSALILAGMRPSQCIILHSQYSIKEYKEFYTLLRQNGYKFEDFLDYNDPRSCYRKYNGNYFILGWCADQMFGSFLNQYYDTSKSWDESLKDLLLDPNPVYYQGLFSDGNLTDIDVKVAQNGIKKYAEDLDMPLDTLFDVTWLVNFGMKWTAVSNNFALVCTNKLVNVSKIYNYYDTDSFSAWAIQNYDYLRTCNQQDSKQYKLALKEIILKLTNDENYYTNKGKVNSWVSNYAHTATGSSLRDEFTILTNKFFQSFSSSQEQVSFMSYTGILKGDVINR